MIARQRPESGALNAEIPPPISEDRIGRGETESPRRRSASGQAQRRNFVRGEASQSRRNQALRKGGAPDEIKSDERPGRRRAAPSRRELRRSATGSGRARKRRGPGDQRKEDSENDHPAERISRGRIPDVARAMARLTAKAARPSNTQTLPKILRSVFIPARRRRNHLCNGHENGHRKINPAAPGDMVGRKGQRQHQRDDSDAQGNAPSR